MTRTTFTAIEATEMTEATLSFTITVKAAHSHIADDVLRTLGIRHTVNENATGTTVVYGFYFAHDFNVAKRNVLRNINLNTL